MMRHAPSIGIGLGLSLRGSGVGFRGLLDQYGGAAAAYSLRALSSGWLAGDVVEVRRSSDSTTDTFTASQITSGAMLDSVNNGTTDLYNSARYFNGTTSVAFPDFAALDLGSIFKIRATFLPTSIAAVGQGICGRWDGASNKRSYLLTFQAVFGVKLSISTDGISTAITLQDGDVSVNELKEIEVIADGVNISLYVNGQIKDSAAFSGTPFASDKTLELGAYNNAQASLTFLGGIISAAELENAGSTVWAVTGLGTSVTAWEDTIGSNDGTETNGAAYTGQPFDGYVSTWYDQSGNANDATQATTTAQPKIVDAGALVTGGIDFDGVDDVLSAVDPLTNSQGLSLFLVANISDGQGQSTIVRHGQANPENAWNFQIATDSGNPLGLIRCSNGTISTGSTEKYVTAGGVVDNFGSLSLYGANHASGAGREILVNGTSLSLSRPFGTIQSSTFNSSEAMSIGANSNGAAPVAGVFGELIVYDSDQTANRAAIETNINDFYSIY